MQRINLIICLFSSLLAGLSLPCAWASGTYPLNPPRPPVAGEDRLYEESYNRGRAIFLGKAELRDEAPNQSVVENARRLASLQVQLPESLRTEVNLPSLSTKLLPADLLALEYYLSKRYKITAKVDLPPPPSTTPTPVPSRPPKHSPTPNLKPSSAPTLAPSPILTPSPSPSAPPSPTVPVTLTPSPSPVITLTPTISPTPESNPDKNISPTSVPTLLPPQITPSS